MFASDGDIEHQEEVDSFIKNNNLRPERIHKGSGYEIHTYIASDIMRQTGRAGMGYQTVNKDGTRVWVVVHNGSADARLHEIAEMRVIRQQQLLAQGKFKASPETIKRLKEMSSHSYVQDYLGYKGQDNQKSAGNPHKAGNVKRVNYANNGVVAFASDGFAQTSPTPRKTTLEETLDRLFKRKVWEESLAIGRIEKVIIEQSNELSLKEKHKKVKNELKAEKEKKDQDIDKIEDLERKEKKLRLRIVGKGANKSTRKLLENKYRTLEYWQRVRNNNTEETAPSNILYWINHHPENFSSQQRKDAAFDAKYLAGAKRNHIDDYIEHFSGRPLTRKANKALTSTLKPFWEGRRLKAGTESTEKALSRVVDIVFSQTGSTQSPALEIFK